MIPYGILIKQNRIIMQHSLVIWQKKFGLLKPSKFIATAVPLICLFTVMFSAVSYFTSTGITPAIFASELFINVALITSFMFLNAVKTVREYGATIKEEKLQLVLKEDVLEITTEFSKEIVPYEDIALCFEKDFVVTLMCDENSFPVAISKMHFEKGSYDIFVSLLKSKLPGKYEKRGEN